MGWSKAKYPHLAGKEPPPRYNKVRVDVAHALRGQLNLPNIPPLTLSDTLVPVAVVNKVIEKPYTDQVDGLSTAAVGLIWSGVTVPKYERWRMLYLRVYRAGIAATFDSIEILFRTGEPRMRLSFTAAADEELYAAVDFSDELILYEGTIIYVNIAVAEPGSSFHFRYSAYKSYVGRREQ